MFTVITGYPGTGKTTRLISLIYSVSEYTYHNIPGFRPCPGVYSLPELDSSLLFRMSYHDGVPTRFRESAVFIDEAHLFFRNFSPDIDITGFIENHCAYGIDIFIAVQNIRQLPSWVLPSVYCHESFFRSPFFMRFGFLTYSSSLCHVTPSGVSMTNRRRFRLTRIDRHERTS
ncbi:MAG: hypothetical protein D3906_10140 [Candidatus Electrothrix sp. AUS1_2]|nr:hypothetical protein [Candidatus Electrothrix sp. AUS1_2]